MKNNQTMHEIFYDISIAPEFEKVNVALKYKNNSPFKKLLSMIYDPRIEWDLPEGEPPYKRDETIPPDYAYTSLAMELKPMYVFFKPSPLHSVVKRENRFIQLLESLHYKESDLLIAIKDKKFDNFYSGVDFKFLYSVFPECFYYDGLFSQGEWFIIELKTTNHGIINENVKIVHKSYLDNINAAVLFVKNVLTGEVIKESQQLEKHLDKMEQIKKEETKKANKEDLKLLKDTKPIKNVETHRTHFIPGIDKTLKERELEKQQSGKPAGRPKKVKE